MSQQSKHVRQDSLFSATALLYLPMNVRCLSCSVTDSGSHSGTPFKAPFVNFCVTKFTQNFLRRHVKENDVLKILAACHSGAPFQPGALRTCVPCLMVNPALVPPVNSNVRNLTVASRFEVQFGMELVTSTTTATCCTAGQAYVHWSGIARNDCKACRVKVQLSGQTPDIFDNQTHQNTP